MRTDNKRFETFSTDSVIFSKFEHQSEHTYRYQGVFYKLFFVFVLVVSPFCEF
jgi:hypothetical protein